MKVSELIERLQHHLEINGPLADYEVWIAGQGYLVDVMRVSTCVTVFCEAEACQCGHCKKRRRKAQP